MSIRYISGVSDFAACCSCCSCDAVRQFVYVRVVALSACRVGVYLFSCLWLFFFALVFAVGDNEEDGPEDDGEWDAYGGVNVFGHVSILGFI